MNAIILAISPFIVSAITGWMKGFTPFANLTDGARTAMVRILAAVISFVYALVGMWITGTIDDGAVATAFEALVLAITPFLGSLGIFHAFFQKKQSV